MAHRFAVGLMLGAFVIMAFGFGYYLESGDVSTTREWLNFTGLLALLAFNVALVVATGHAKRFIEAPLAGSVFAGVAGFGFGMGQVLGNHVDTSEVSPILIVMWFGILGFVPGFLAGVLALGLYPLLAHVDNLRNSWLRFGHR